MRCILGAVRRYIRRLNERFDVWMDIEVILVSVLETGLPGIAQTAGSDHHFSAVRIRINFWRMVGLYISFGDWANALECWRSPSLRLVIPGIAVSPGVTHSDSRIVFVTGTVVKPQQPTDSMCVFASEGTWVSKIPSEGKLSYQAPRWNLGYLSPFQVGTGGRVQHQRGCHIGKSTSNQQNTVYRQWS